MSLSDLIDAQIDRHAGSTTTLTEYRAAHYRYIARSLVACQSPNEAPEAEHDEIEHEPFDFGLIRTAGWTWLHFMSWIQHGA